MALTVGQVTIGDTPTIIGSVAAARRVIVTTVGPAGVYLGRDATVSATTGFFMGSTTTGVDHIVVLDLQAGDALWGMSAGGVASQTVYFLAYVPITGV